MGILWGNASGYPELRPSDRLPFQVIPHGMDHSVSDAGAGRMLLRLQTGAFLHSPLLAYGGQDPSTDRYRYRVREISLLRVGALSFRRRQPFRHVDRLHFVP